MEVKVAKIGAKESKVKLEAPAKKHTVKDVLKTAGVDPVGFTIMVNGVEAKMDDVVNANDVVTLVPNIRGGICI